MSGGPSLRRPWLPVALALAALTVGGCGADETVVVETAEVSTGEVVQTVAAPARLEPRERRVVTAAVPGTVADLLVDAGAQVAAGDPVVRLASDSLDAALAQAGSAVDAAGALSGVALAPDLSPLIGAVRAQLETAIEPLIAAVSAQANRLEQPELREQALTAVAELVSRYEQTRDDLRSAERQAAASSAAASASQRAAAEAQRDQAEAALEAAQTQRDALELVAPIDGIVEFGASAPLGGLGGESGLDGLFGGAASPAGPLAVGSVVAPGQALFTVYDLGGFHAVATVDEIDVVLVEEGQRATVLVDAFPDLELAGFVARVAVAPQTTSAGGVVYAVDVELTETPREVQLRVGLTASAEIVVARVDGDRVVPSAALRRRDGGEVVLVARDGVVHVVPVTVVALGADVAAVEGDLQPGERVVTVGADELEDGDRLP